MDKQNYKETAIQNEQQLKPKQEIINNIIEILVNSNLTITDSKDILYETAKAIYNQKVTLPTISTGWINANNYIDKFKNIK